MSITSDTDKTSIMKKNKCSLAAVFLLSSVPIISAETIEQKTSQDAKKQRPNILWLTFEDMNSDVMVTEMSILRLSILLHQRAFCSQVLGQRHHKVHLQDLP